MMRRSARRQTALATWNAAPDGAPPAHVWQFEGRLYPQIALNAVAGRNRTEFGVEPNRFDEILPGCYDPRARVADMDRDGVEAQLCFPSFPKFAGTVFLQATDRELAQRCVEAYNDFILDEWCAYAPDRLIPLIILPLWDAGLAAKEIERCAARTSIGWPGRSSANLRLRLSRSCCTSTLMAPMR